MTRTLKLLLASLPLAYMLALFAGHTTAAADTDEEGAVELRAVSYVHGVSFKLAQREVGAADQGPTTMVTRVQATEPTANNTLPPAPNVELVVSVTAPDMATGHAAGALAALGLMQGMTVQQIEGAFAQLNWNVQIAATRGHVDATIDATRAGALVQLVTSAILAGDRPGGGCDAAIPLLQQGAQLLGF